MEFVLDEGIAHEEAMLLIAATPAGKNSFPIDNPLGLGQQRKGTRKHGLPIATKTELSHLQATQVLVQTGPAQHEKPRYFFMVDPSFAVTQCSSCNHFFEQEELDLAMLEHGSCPFCGVDPPRLLPPLSSDLHMPGLSDAGTLLPLLPLPSARSDTSQSTPLAALPLEPKKSKAPDVKLQKESQALFCMTRQDLVRVNGR